VSSSIIREVYMSTYKVKVRFTGYENIVVVAGDATDAVAIAEEQVYNDLIDLNREFDVETYEWEELT